MKLCPNIPNQGFWQNKKVLVTGHTGFKGKWLTAVVGLKI